MAEEYVLITVAELLEHLRHAGALAELPEGAQITVTAEQMAELRALLAEKGIAVLSE